MRDSLGGGVGGVTSSVCHSCPALCVFAQRGCLVWINVEQPQQPRSTGRNVRFAYLGFPLLSAQDGSLQENNLFGRQTSITKRRETEKKRNSC